MSLTMGNHDNLYELKVGSRVLNNFTILDMNQKRPFPTLNFICDLHMSREFPNIDLKDGVSLTQKSDNRLLFGGYVHELLYSDRSAVFMCKGGYSFLHNLKIRFDYFKIRRGEKLLWFLAHLVSRRENIHMQDLMLRQVDLTEKEYIIISPVKNIVLTKDLKIGDVTFYSVFDSPEDEIISATRHGQKESEWKEIPVRARIKVVAEDFYGAIKDGRQRISKAIDLIAFRNDLTFPVLTHNKKLDFSNERYFARVDLSTKVFCKEAVTPESVLFDLRTVEETTLKLRGDEENYFSAVTELFKNIIASDVELSAEQRITGLTLHWLRLAIHADDLETKLVNLWHAVEFAANDISSDKKFTQSDIEQIKSKIKEIKVNGRSLSDDKIRILEDKIGQLNNAPLMARLREFVSKNSIPFDDSEYRLIQQARKKRNDIEHGKGNVEIERYELEKLQSLIERIVIKKMELARLH